MKKLLSVLLCVTMLLGVCAMLTACGGGSTLTLNHRLRRRLHADPERV